ncbi:cytochrome P450 4B1-like [Pelobates cultripes]|uniref:Cytochrome P450 4B1-like n=1 Tax=Pelobates cultripes TaxID=61616 RepID=A0AAD1SUN6_PELCU|nr:cytochrome P450 4B1-like [Pelobates cultripes]
MSDMEREDRKGYIEYEYLIPWIDEGLLLLSGQKWFQHRRLLTSGFHYDVLKPYVKIMGDCTKVMLSGWRRRDPNQAAAKLYPYVQIMNRCPKLHSIFKCRMQMDPECQQLDAESHPSVSFSLPPAPLGPPLSACFPFHDRAVDQVRYLLFESYRPKTQCLVRQEVNGRELECQPGLAETDKETDQVSCPQCLTFPPIPYFPELSVSIDRQRPLLARLSFETLFTFNSLISPFVYHRALCYVSHSQESCSIKRKLFGVYIDRSALSWDDLSKLLYITMCIKESLRLNTPVPVISRHMNEPITFSDG